MYFVFIYYTMDEEQIHGLPQYLYVGQFGRTDELNQRILDRTVSDKPLAPNFSQRPTMSKYALYPMFERSSSSSVPIEENYNHSLEKNFSPPVAAVGPVSGFINNVDQESELRNQYHALQKGAGQDVYIPSSNSDLYKVSVVSRPSEQPYPGLFETQQFDQRNHANLAHGNIGKETFHNNTRTQLRK
jgi:hypothetical protein